MLIRTLSHPKNGPYSCTKPCETVRIRTLSYIKKVYETAYEMCETVRNRATQTVVLPYETVRMVFRPSHVSYAQTVSHAFDSKTVATTIF